MTGNKPHDCALCDRSIDQWRTGESVLFYLDKAICFDCYTGLIEPIYSMSGSGDGGVINFTFNSLVSTGYNRKKRNSLKQNKSLFQRLLHKYKFKCVDCGETDVKTLTIDHKRPVSKGGSDNLSNLQILCHSCNSRKSDKYDVEKLIHQLAEDGLSIRDIVEQVGLSKYRVSRVLKMRDDRDTCNKLS